MTHLAYEELESLFAGFELRHYAVTRVGRGQKHIGHHVVFRAPAQTATARAAEAGPSR